MYTVKVHSCGSEICKDHPCSKHRARVRVVPLQQEIESLYAENVEVENKRERGWDCLSITLAFIGDLEAWLREGIVFSATVPLLDSF